MIPIQNLYYLLLYAWDVMTPRRAAEVDGLPKTSIVDLLATVLQRGLDRLLRQGADRGYLARREAIAGIRGKPDISGTVKRNLRLRGQMTCEFDELDPDVPHNRILKATVRHLLQVDGLDPRITAELRLALQRFPPVRDVPLSDGLFRSVQLHRNIGAYRLLLDVCRLITECLVPEGKTGRLRFRQFDRDEERMHTVFERFVRNFYRQEQSAWKVRREVIRWQATTAAPASLDVLPRMETDVSLTRPGRRLVIDAKYYREPLVERHGRRAIRSPHLYQLSAYLMNLRAREDREASIEGLLLYPASPDVFDFTFHMHGSPVRICTVDLNQHWTGIRTELLSKIEVG